MTDTKALNAGNGGETHQVTDADHPVLTTNHGTPIADNQNQLKAGANRRYLDQPLPIPLGGL